MPVCRFHCRFGRRGFVFLLLAGGQRQGSEDKRQNAAEGWHRRDPFKQENQGLHR